MGDFGDSLTFLMYPDGDVVALFEGDLGTAISNALNTFGFELLFPFTVRNAT
jgi:hypothetical protein